MKILLALQWHMDSLPEGEGHRAMAVLFVPAEVSVAERTSGASDHSSPGQRVLAGTLPALHPRRGPSMTTEDSIAGDGVQTHIGLNQIPQPPPHAARIENLTAETIHWTLPMSYRAHLFVSTLSFNLCNNSKA